MHSDADGIADCVDNCPLTFNSDQIDEDMDGTGNACDECPADPDKIVGGDCGCGSPDVDTQMANADVAHRGSGRLCIGPSGEVWPCIFSRWMPIGRVTADRGLAQVLAEARPRPGWLRPGMTDTDCNDKLQCGECRIAAAAFAAMAGEVLGTKAGAP